MKHLELSPSKDTQRFRYSTSTTLTQHKLLAVQPTPPTAENIWMLQKQRSIEPRFWNYLLVRCNDALSWRNFLHQRRYALHRIRSLGHYNEGLVDMSNAGGVWRSILSRSITNNLVTSIAAALVSNKSVTHSTYSCVRYVILVRSRPKASSHRTSLAHYTLSFATPASELFACNTTLQERPIKKLLH